MHLRIVINDVSFQYQFHDEQTALQKLHDFIYICKELESGRLKNVEGIISDYIEVSKDIVPGCKLIRLLQRFETKDEKRYLLGLLTGRPSIPADEKVICKIDGKESLIWKGVFDNMMVSLLSDPVFENCEVSVDLERDEKKIRNLSQDIHIDCYRNELGMRIYEANSEKHKKDRENPYGKGKVASPMDLGQEEAQELLDKAITVNGRLYARKNGVNYAFQNTRDVIYHGYRADDLSDNIRRELDKHEWDV